MNQSVQPPIPPVQIPQSPSLGTHPQSSPNSGNTNPNNQPAATPKTSQSTIDKLKSQVQQLEQKKLQQEQTVKQQSKPLSSPQSPAVQSLASPHTTQPVSSPRKEQKGQTMTGSLSPEHLPIQERSLEFEAPPEVQQWVETKPDPIISTIPTPVEDEFGEILLKASNVPKPNIILPIDEEELEKTFHHKVADSIRWLGEWCKRVIKVYPQRAYFKQTQSQTQDPTQSTHHQNDDNDDTTIKTNNND